MQYSFELWIQTRKNVLAITKPYSFEQLQIIPNFANNNIIWHMGHIVATQQTLLYRLSQLPTQLDKTFIDLFKNGTKPEGPYSEELYQIIRTSLKDTSSVISDYENGVFKEFTPYTTRYGNTMHSVEDAIQFNNLHEALHFSNIMTYLKCV